MGEAGIRARALFEQGYNCSQSVAGAFAAQMGLAQETVLSLSQGFGGGFGRMRMVCGAFSGITLVMGMHYGRFSPADKSRIYAVEQELARRFRGISGGSLICAELLGLEGRDTSPNASPRTEAYYRKRPCKELVAAAADLLEDYLAEHPTL